MVMAEIEGPIVVKITLDEQANFELKANKKGQPYWSDLVLELSPARAMALWHELEFRLEEEGLIWDDEEH